MRLLALSLILWLDPLHAVEPDALIAIIVHPEQKPERIDLRELSLIYRKKRQLWDNGRSIVPVNLPANHPLRERFVRSVLRQTLEDQEEYWNQQYFQGVLPPHVLASEKAVLRFVAATPQSIGYLSYCLQDDSVQMLMALDRDGRPVEPAHWPACPAAAGATP